MSWLPVQQRRTRRRRRTAGGLTRSTFDPGDPGRAVGHWRPYDRAGRELPVEVPMVAASGLCTSVEDALRFVQLHLRRGDPLLRPEVITAGQATQNSLPSGSNITTWPRCSSS